MDQPKHLDAWGDMLSKKPLIENMSDFIGCHSFCLDIYSQATVLEEIFAKLLPL